MLTQEPSSMILRREAMLGARMSEGMSEWTFSRSQALMMTETSEKFSKSRSE